MLINVKDLKYQGFMDSAWQWTRIKKNSGGFMSFQFEKVSMWQATTCSSKWHIIIAFTQYAVIIIFTMELDSKK